MTPIEIIEAHNRGDKLEYAPSSPLSEWQDITCIGITIQTQSHSYSSFGKSDIAWIRTKRETFGFDEAVNRLEAGKTVGKLSEDGRTYRLHKEGELLWLELERALTEHRAGTLGNFNNYGYPLSWPKATDFYEVETK